MFIEKFKMKWKISILTLLSLTLVSCGEEVSNEKSKIINNATPPSPQNGVLIDTKIFDQEEFLFVGHSSLSKNLNVSARKVFFRFGSEVKINEFHLSIQADEIYFEKQTSLIAFNTYAACKTHGKNAGSIEIEANKIIGRPLLDLAGQNAGQIGIYSASDAGKPISSKHKLLRGFGGKDWFRGCETHIKGFPRDAPHLFNPKIGGSEGRLLLNALSHNEFFPQISNRVSHSSYEALIEGNGKIISWSEVVPRGPNGQPGDFCYLIESEYLCK